MRADEIREGDIVEIDYITDFTKEHINEGKALVIWKGFNNQPLVHKLNTKTTIWDCYEHIAKVVGHIDLEGYMNKALEQEPCEDVVSRNAIIQTLNNMDRYVANELILCDTNNKFPQNELFIVDDVYEQIAEQLPSVTPKQQTCEDCISRQAAIDVLRDDREWHRSHYNYCPNCGADMKVRIRNENSKRL